MTKIFNRLLALSMGLAFVACGPGITPETPEEGTDPETENPTPEIQYQDCYVPVVADKTDWSGDYLIAAENREGKEIVFGKWSNSKYGQPAGGIDLMTLKDKEGRIPAAGLEECKTVVTLTDRSYSVYVTGVGYLGLEKRHNLCRGDSAVEDNFKWTFEFDPESGVTVISNLETEGRQLVWNDYPDRQQFVCQTSTHDEICEIILYERVEVSLTPEN